jgi:hypothetical protein
MAITFARTKQLEDLKPIKIRKISFFDQFIKHFMRETLDAGGVVEVALDDNNQVDGVFVFDSIERNGTVFTRSREILNHYIRIS